MAKIGILISENYKYENVVLESGAKVTSPNVLIQNGKVSRVDNANVNLGEQGNFSFSINNYGVDGGKTHSTSGVPEGVSAEAIMKEFVDFVEQDITA